MSTDSVREARQELLQILKSVCDSDAYALGAVLVNVEHDLVVMKHVKNVRPDVGPSADIELGGGILGQLSPALKELCSPSRLNLGDPLFSIIIASKGTAIIHLVTSEFVIVVYGVRGLNISFIAQQLAQYHKRLKTLINQAELKTEVSEWGL